ncbi:MAG: hypothetical protein ACYC09_07540 [Bacteroidota bacterium]
MKKLPLTIISTVMAFAFSAGCNETIFGEKEPNIGKNFPVVPATDVKPIEFIQLTPEWYGFNHPEDVMVGYDELIYVADTDNDRVVQMDVNGTVLGSISIPHPVAIAQDRRLDLLVVGRKDTVVGANALSLACLYRIKLYPVNNRITDAVAIPAVIHPGYILGRTLRASDSSIYFTGVATMADNSYYITRTGPFNSDITQPGGPDNNILSFGSNDQLQSPLTAYLTATGTGKASANNITSITTYAVPPQRANVDARRHFITTLRGENSFRVQGMRFSSGREDVAYTADPELEFSDTTIGHRFLYDADPTDGILQSIFKSPEDVTYAADRGYIFVVDSGTDSVYQFTSTGIEGILPPSFSSDRKNIIVSFGGTGSGLRQFNDPMGVAYYQPDRVLLIADAGNNRIVRYKLSTDIK